MQCFFFISIYQNIVSIKLYSGDYSIKLLNNTKLSNVMKNKYCILFMKDYLLKIMGIVAVGILRSTDFRE